MSAFTTNFVECLEGRRLMDATLPTAPAAESFAAPVQPAHELHHPAQAGGVHGQALPQGSSRKRAPVAPNIVGTWRGTATAGAGAFTTTLPFELHITRQTSTTLTGTITIGSQTYRGTSTVRWTGRRFTIQYVHGKVSLTISGSVNAARNELSATANGSGAMSKVVGHISARRV